MISNKKAVYIIIFVVVGFAAVSFGFKIIFGLYNPFYVVASGSMIPNLNIGDLLIIRHNTSDTANTPYSFNNLKVGDIIVFKTLGVNNERQHLTIVHRVAHIFTARDENGNNQRIIVTKGDANPGSIRLLDYPIMQANYIGKVVYVIPQLGLVTQVIRPPINYIIIGVIVIALIYLIRKAKTQ
jgi:signal peptidase